MVGTVSSLEASKKEKALIEDLVPWPLQNEECWGVARKHIGPLEAIERRYRVIVELVRSKGSLYPISTMDKIRKLLEEENEHRAEQETTE